MAERDGGHFMEGHAGQAEELQQGEATHQSFSGVLIQKHCTKLAGGQVVGSLKENQNLFNMCDPSSF